jgi:ATP-binding cassette subfamily B protein
MVSVKRISEIFNKKINIKDKTKTDDFDSKIKGQIIFENVYFKYPNSDEYILKNINFKAEKGTTTAFIGSTGSGKTTLINLIPRFFDVTSGQIKIDGQNIKNVKIKELRNKIGYVPQKSILFSGTIKTNINFGQKKQSDKKIEEAARISQSLEFINMEKEKFERPISEKGNNVSGGQRQRISIARAIANDPEIYIFDDSFSALDYKTDSMLRKELKKSSKDQTIIMVSSRIASIMNADQIIVLDEGEIVGIGTHEELLKTCKIYKEIKESQLGGEN